MRNVWSKSLKLIVWARKNPSVIILETDTIWGIKNSALMMLCTYFFFCGKQQSVERTINSNQATSHLVFEKCMLSAISSMCIMDFKNSIKTERNEKCFSKVKSHWLKSSVNARSQELYIEFQCRNFSFINSFFLGNLKWADD